MKIDQQALWQTLKEYKLLSGELPESTELESPWYIRLLVGIGGWLAAIFILGFIGTGFAIVFRSEEFGSVIGILMALASYIMLRSFNRNDFAEQFALAVSFAGQAVFALGLFKIFRGESGTAYLLFALFQAALAWFMPSSVHRIWSSFAAAIALNFGLSVFHVFYIQTGIFLALAALIWLHEYRWFTWRRMLNPIAYGLTLALIYIQAIGSHYHYLLFRLISGSRKLEKFWFQPWMGELLCGVVAVLVVWKLLERYRKPLLGRTSIIAFLVTLMVIAASFKAGGLTVGLVILLLGFANGNAVLTSLGVVFLLYFISSYYYLLQSTLLQKSGTLLVLGIVMLLAGWIMHRFFRDPEVKHAR